MSDRKTQIFKIVRLMGCTALCGMAFMAGAGTTQAALSPAGDWSVTPIQSGANAGGSYCALTRPFSDNLMLTIGQNKSSEYSLAIDFLDGGLSMGKSYSVTLQPAPGQIRAYQITPASQRALVVRIGMDEEFLSTLENSKELKAQIDGKDYQFALSDMAQGSQKLKDCMASLGGGMPPVIAETPDSQPIEVRVADLPKEKPVLSSAEPKQDIIEKPTEEVLRKAPEKIVQEKIVEKVPENIPVKPMEQFSAEKISTEKIMDDTIPEEKVSLEKPFDPIEKSKPSVPVVIAKPERVSKSVVETAKVTEAVPAAPVKTPAPVLAPVIPPAEIVKSEVIAPPAVKPPEEVKQEARQEVAKLEVEKPRAVSRMADVNGDSKPQIWSTSRRQQQEELDKMRAENDRLNQALQAEVQKQPAKISKDQKAPAQARSEMKDNGDVIRLKAQIATLEAKLAAQESAIKAQDAIEAQATSQKAKENAPQPADVAEKTYIDPDLVAEVEALRAENKKLLSAMQGQDEKLSSLDVKDPQAEKELEVIRSEVARLRDENKRLSDMAREAHGKVDSAVVSAGGEALTKIREYEKRLEAMTSDNITLSKEIEELRRMQEDVKLGSVAGDWDLEKATKRYNEAEREIRRLGMLLEQQRLAHRQEKEELEKMLFDPAVTDEQQRARLVELEAKLMAAEKQLEAAGRASPQDRYDGSLARLQTPEPPMEKATSGQVWEERVGMTATPVPPRSVLPPQEASQKLPEQTMQKPLPKAERVSSVRAPDRTERKPQNLIAAPAPRVEMEPEPMIADLIAPEPMPEFDPIPHPLPEPKRLEDIPSPRTASAAIAAASPNHAVMVQEILTNASIPLGGTVKGQSGRVEWQTGRIRGEAKIVPSNLMRDMGQFIASHIEQARQSCGGDFAAAPTEAASSRYRAYDIVCVGSSQSVSSSVVFTEKDGQIMAISHFADAADLDKAIDLRDRVAAKL